MTIAITGGRDYKLTSEDWFWLGAVCGKLYPVEPIFIPAIFIHGGAVGVDTEVSQMLRHYGYITKEFPAQWDTFGKSAGFIRNKEMAALCDILLAFPGGKGTAHMVEVTKKLGKEIRESPTRK